LYAALALGFGPPTAETLERFSDAEALAALADAARVLGIECVPVGRAGADLEALAANHRRLFGHTARGEVPPYETEYGEEALFQQPQELGDLAGFLRAFGLELRADARERIDHVSCECEFLSFLACKEGYAIHCGDEEMRATTARAAALLLRDHLGRFTPAFRRRLQRLDPSGFYGALAGLLRALVEYDCRRLGLVMGPEHLTLRPDPAACAAPMGCGTEAEEGSGPASAGASPRTI
jgi:DMSO reductase family type II enzyme chaperone